MYRFTRILFANHRRFGSFKNQVDFVPKFPKADRTIKFMLGSSGLMAFFEKKKEEDMEKQESDLIMAIKRGEMEVWSF